MRTLVDLDGLAVEVRTVAQDPCAPALPTCVFLHEGLGSLELWRDFPDTVRARAGGPPMLVYSRPGYGRSAPGAAATGLDYLRREALETLPALLGRLGVPRPLLIGHSDGASIALRYAAAGHSVAGVVAIAPHVFVEQCTIDGIRAACKAFETGDLRARLALHHDDVDGVFRAWSGAWLDPAWRSWAITDSLTSITAPILVLQGTDDPYGTRAQADTIAALAGGEVTVRLLAATGHAPHVERQVEVADQVAGFIRSCSN